MRLGVLGGTFNPIHLGHLILAEEACSQLALDRVLWVLTPAPPHKPNQAILGWVDRLQMLMIAVTGNPRFEISFVDIQRRPPYYACDTIFKLREQYADDQLFFLMGSDSLINLPGWYRPQELVEACDGLGVMMRSEALIDDLRLEEIIPGIFKKVKFLSASLIEISSSDSRRRIAQGEPYRYYLHPEVYEYIRRQNYYHP